MSECVMSGCVVSRSTLTGVGAALGLDAQVVGEALHVARGVDGLEASRELEQDHAEAEHVHGGRQVARAQVLVRQVRTRTVHPAHVTYNSMFVPYT
jgi:hypothetical protein